MERSSSGCCVLQGSPPSSEESENWIFKESQEAKQKRGNHTQCAPITCRVCIFQRGIPNMCFET
ncbi:hypothetical protein B0T16DRAFT_14722 [Cercophora newfieldiana]|uniref:Uncharacterized protein n=1 Tax=Cercophora newfieldiana TaxID=92897 RepID=A0AA39YN96_9PEZI|nr:hypothetical protein B0T16DRAFT_14722 [Cercophora newfieldiana]